MSLHGDYGGKFFYHSTISRTLVEGEGFYPSAEVQSVYSIAPADWAIHRVKCKNSFISDNSARFKYAVYMLKQFYFEQFSLA